MKLLAPLTAALLPVLLATAAPAPTPSVDPAAVASLQRMSDTLAAAKAFTVRTRALVELPALTGQSVTLVSTGRIALRRPGELRGIFRGDAPHFDFYFADGTVSASAPQAGVYSVKKAPATIDAMLSGLHAETGIRFVLAPFLRSNPAAVLTAGLQSAAIVGPSLVDGILCEHLAFRAPGVNWEIWLSSDARALPRRLAVTFTDRPGNPRTLMEFTHWNLRPWCLGSFAFSPPKGAREVPFPAVLKSTSR